MLEATVTPITTDLNITGKNVLLEDAARALRVSPKAIKRAIREGLIKKAVPFGHTKQVDMNEVAEAMTKLLRPAARPKLDRQPLPRVWRGASQATLRLLANLATARDAAEICNVPLELVERLAQTGAIPVYGPTALVDLSDVEAIASMPTEEQDLADCVKRMLSEGASAEQAAEAYDVTVRTVQRIRSATTMTATVS